MLQLDIGSEYILTLSTPFIGENGVEYRAVCGVISKIIMSKILCSEEITIGALTFSGDNLEYALKCNMSCEPRKHTQTIYYA